MATLGAARLGTEAVNSTSLLMRKHAGTQALKAGDVVNVTLEPDTEEREIEVPIQLRRAAGREAH